MSLTAGTYRATLILCCLLHLQMGCTLKIFGESGSKGCGDGVEFPIGFSCQTMEVGSLPTVADRQMNARCLSDVGNRLRFRCPSKRRRESLRSFAYGVLVHLC